LLGKVVNSSTNGENEYNQDYGSMEYNQLGESSEENIQAAKANLPGIIIGTKCKSSEAPKTSS
jgi:hypothetical protein